MMNALVLKNKEKYTEVFTRQMIEKISKHHNLLTEPIIEIDLEKHSHTLKKTDILFTTWGAPYFDEALLSKFPRLKYIFYAAGDVNHLISQAIWDRGIQVSTAKAINTIPVAEYTLAQILFSLKGGWNMVRSVKENQDFSSKNQPWVGNYGKTIGLISLSEVGKEVIKYLKGFNYDILIYDPYVSEEICNQYEVQKANLKDVFLKVDLISLHAPLTSETTNMINKELFSVMKKHAIFINTARGAIVNEREMIEVLQKRKDITAILDVTDPEPPENDSELYKLENVILTPHMAGSLGTERERLAQVMVEESIRYLNREPLKFEMKPEKASI